MPQDSVPPTAPQPNGDEDLSFGPQAIRYIGNFHKTLPHNEYGEVLPAAYAEFRTIAADSNAPGAGDFEGVDRGPLSFPPHQAEFVPANTLPPGATLPTMADRLVNPQAGRAREECGPDPQALNMMAAPGVLSDSTAAEMVELYWMALLRDVSFDLYDQPGQLDTCINDLKPAFQYALAHDTGAGKLRLGLDLPKDAAGALRLDAKTLFRCGMPDEDYGPLISQFFLHDVTYGTQTIKQHQFPYREGRDYLTDHKSWLLAQNAGYDKFGLPYPNDNSWFHDKLVFDDVPAGATAPRKHRIRNMRDLARFVNKDALHQAYFNAALLLLGWGAPLDPGSPYANGTYTRQRDFGTLGGPHILTQVSEVASRALKVVWRQKWLVHRRLRPEAYGGLMQMQKNGYQGTTRPYGLPDWVFTTAAAQAVQGKHGTLFLPMAFSQGSPAHPAYGAGHATVAGACVTMLKAWFKEEEPIGPIIRRNVHPDTLRPITMLQPKETPNDDLPTYAGSDADHMTVGGELNKIAANVAMGRSMGGVHWRTDNTRSLRLGERIATIMLKRQSTDYAETPFCLSYRSFDGALVTVEKGHVTVAGDPQLEAFYNGFA